MFFLSYIYIVGIPFGIEVGREESKKIEQSLEIYRQRMNAVVPPERPALGPVADLLPVSLSKGEPLKVYTDIDFLPPVLTWKEFKVVDSAQGIFI